MQMGILPMTALVTLLGGRNPIHVVMDVKLENY